MYIHRSNQFCSQERLASFPNNKFKAPKKLDVGQRIKTSKSNKPAEA